MPFPSMRLQILIGPTLPRPAPYAVADALTDLVVTNKDQERDGFQMTFSLGKDSPLDYGLLLNGLFDPPNRVVIVVFIGTTSQILIDGIITNHQVAPSNKPGESTLVVTGEDISLMLDLVEKSMTHSNQPDSIIVTKLLTSYATYGLTPKVTSTTDAPLPTERVPTQQTTDLRYIQTLAQRNGFVFYIEPTQVPCVNTAYWGPDNRLGAPQAALTMNMGPETNVDTSIRFSFNSLGPATPQVTIVDRDTKAATSVTASGGSRPPLASQPAQSLRKTIVRDVANLSHRQAELRASSSSTQTSDAVNGSGEVDAVRYGHVLHARQLVGVRGVGNSYDGNYYIQQVTHHIKRGSYKQSFTLKREGRGALAPTVAT
jgi:hypothetical protein